MSEAEEVRRWFLRTIHPKSKHLSAQKEIYFDMYEVKERTKADNKKLSELYGLSISSVRCRLAWVKSTIETYKKLKSLGRL